jgi:proteasome lid subunit RPN8/RPN11
MTINQSLLAALHRHTEAAYPEEGCGVLLGHLDGDSGRIAALVPVENRDPDERARRYLIGPADYLRAEREAERQGLDVVGFYHSHPDHPARPSATDLAEATFPGFVYTITAVADGHAEETTAWRLADDRSRFLPVPLIVPESAS